MHLEKSLDIIRVNKYNLPFLSFPIINQTYHLPVAQGIRQAKTGTIFTPHLNITLLLMQNHYKFRAVIQENIQAHRA